MPPFIESRLKINRANAHIRDADARIVSLHQSDTSVVEVNPNTGSERLKHDFLDTAAFDDIALFVGDAVHNLKCALDYLWLQTISKLVPANVDDRAKFPVHKAIEELEGALTKTNVRTTCPALFDFMIHMIQPYDGGNLAIWPIHNFDNRDKHRLLIPVLTSASIDAISVVDEHGES